jgi:flagellar biosynthetic protein FliP
MATNMTVGMALWMWIRRHSWPRIAEMSAAMVLPFAVLLVPFWLGTISGMTLMMAGHVLMVPLMLAAMLWRRAEYSHHRH